ncbi:hypothetical protein F5887DRAFT_1077986 [Amanita rubescens]|nr:hypothetical protein F5887DRAFT_1077986 [Amanita rubescens]
MSTLSLFSVNGISATAVVNTSLQTTTICPSFALRLGLSHGDTTLISAPMSDRSVSSSVVIHIAEHVSDAVGQKMDLSLPSAGVGFQYNSGQRHGMIVFSQSSSVALYDCNDGGFPQLHMSEDMYLAIHQANRLTIAYRAHARRFPQGNRPQIYADRIKVVLPSDEPVDVQTKKFVPEDAQQKKNGEPDSDGEFMKCFDDVDVAEPLPKNSASSSSSSTTAPSTGEPSGESAEKKLRSSPRGPQGKAKGNESNMVVDE